MLPARCSSPTLSTASTQSGLDRPSNKTQGKSATYPTSAINFHHGETRFREPTGSDQPSGSAKKLLLHNVLIQNTLATAAAGSIWVAQKVGGRAQPLWPRREAVIRLVAEEPFCRNHPYLKIEDRFKSGARSHLYRTRFNYKREARK